MTIRQNVCYVPLVIFARMAYQIFAQRERIVQILVPANQLNVHLEVFAMEADITSPAQLEVSVTTVLQFSVRLVHTVQQMELPSQKTVQLEVIALAANIKSYVKLEISVLMVLQFSVQLVHIALKVARSSQKTVQQEVIALAVVTLKNVIWGLFRLGRHSVVLHVILDISVIKLVSANRFLLILTL